MRHPATLQATTKSCSDENCPSMTGGPKYIVKTLAIVVDVSNV